MEYLEFDYNLDSLRRLTSDFTPCIVERRDNVFSLGIGLTSRCNFRCPMCYYHGSDNAPLGQDMSLSMLKTLISPLPQLASIIVGLEGEPFCHPHFFEALDLMATRTNNLRIVSNGSLISPGVARQLSAYPIGSVVLSIDAGDEATYRRFRKGGDLRNFKRIGATLAEQLGDRLLLHAVLFAENLNSLASLPDIASDMGIRWISMQQFRPTTAALRRNIHPAEKEKLKEGIKRIINSAERRNVVLLFEHRFGNKEITDSLYNISKKCKFLKIYHQNNIQCRQIFNFASILSSGKFFPCCGDFTPTDIYTNSFDGIFNHEYLQRLRFLHAHNIYISPCRSCLHIN